jgi:hypothetical protein
MGTSILKTACVSSPDKEKTKRTSCVSYSEKA